MTAITDAEAQADVPPRKKKRLVSVLIGLVLMLSGAGGGYFAVSSGLLSKGRQGEQEAAHDGEHHAPAAAEVAFVPLDSLVVNLPPGSSRSYLRFSGSLEVSPEAAEDVAAMLPRITDVLNGYLRAVRPDDLETSSSLTRLRSQLLRRVQVVTGDNRVRDLLVSEFVLN